MNPLRMQAQIELSKLKQEQTELDVKLSRLFFEIQTMANPYYKDIEDIKAQEIEQAGDDILSVVERLKTVKTEIKKIEKDWL